MLAALCELKNKLAIKSRCVKPYSFQRCLLWFQVSLSPYPIGMVQGSMESDNVRAPARSIE